MDKTFNDLMDIVNRTKKIDELEGGNRPKRIVREVEPEVEESVEKTPRPSLFEPDAIKKFLNKEKEVKTKKTTKKTTKKSTKKSTKKTTTKSGAKTTKKSDSKTATKKATTKATEKPAVDKAKKANEIAEKFKLIKDKEVVKPSKVPALDMSDPKNVELYNALKETLFAGGTDVSDYMPKDSNPAVTASKLNELFTKKKSKDDYDSLTQEQREYEQLFTGSFLGDSGSDRHDEMSDDDLQKVLEKQSTESEFVKDSSEENLNTTADLDNSNEVSEEAYNDAEESAENNADERKSYTNRFDRDLEEYNSRDRDLDEKIAEYYKRKNEKINEYNTKIASDEENEENVATDEYSDKQRDYADIFSGSMTEREEVLPKDEVEEVKEDEEDKPKDFGTIYRELNSGDYDDDDRFITPSSEKIGGDEYVTVKDSTEDSKEIETDTENEMEEKEIDTEDDEENLEYSKQSFADDDMMEVPEDNESELDDIYDLSKEDSDLDDYIVSSNIPVEKENDGESNTMVMTPNQLPETKFDVLGEENDKEEDGNSDAISKQEFYNEMARLQENLLNELKSESKPKEVEPVSTDNTTLNKALDIISQLALNKNEDKSAKDLHAEKVADDLITEIDKDMKVSRLMGEDNTIEDAIISQISSAQNEENQVEEKEGNSESVFENLDKKESEVSPAETYTGDSLLNADVALNEDDLEYLVNSEKLKAEKSENFYLSEGDKESRADIQASTTAPKSVEPFKEMGDLNLNKDINNAVSTKEEIETKEKLDTEVTQTPKDDMELIYTLFGIQKKKMENKQNEIKVLFVASECQPFIATGGLGDVVGSLPKAIARIGGVDMRVILPLYSKIKNEYKDKLEYICNFTVHLSWRQEYCGLFRYVMDGVTYYFVDNERYFKRPQPYGYYDDGERFGYFCKAVVESLPMLDFFPDIIHCNDWQSALVSTYIKTGNWSDFRYYKIKNIYTIHNVEYQGVYGMENLKDLFGVDNRFKNDLEYNGDINLTKAAIQFSDKFTTVSESYCDNLKQPYCSKGLNHIIVRNEYKLCGIINGIDYDFYNPKTDKIIYKNYDENSLDDKVFNKKIWQDELGLPVDATTPMLAVVSRLVSHKGMDLLTKVLEDLLSKDIQLVVVGTGEQRYVDYFKYLEGKYPTKVRALVDKYSNENARKAYASSDIFLMPSKVEPCGISQMIASRYGSIPVVREVGGLKDSIKDFGCENGGNGYTFASYNPNDLKNQITRAIDDYHDTPNWKKKMYTVMTTNFTWEKSAHKYIDLYKSLID